MKWSWLNVKYSLPCYFRDTVCVVRMFALETRGKKWDWSHKPNPGFKARIKHFRPSDSLLIPMIPFPTILTGIISYLVTWAIILNWVWIIESMKTSISQAFKYLTWSSSPRRCCSTLSTQKVLYIRCSVRDSTVDPHTRLREMSRLQTAQDKK